MHPPRWVVWILLGLSLLAVLAACFSWYIWPVRVARSFVASMADEKLEMASALLVDGEWTPVADGFILLETSGQKLVLPRKVWKAGFEAARSEKLSRTFADAIAGRQSVKLKAGSFGDLAFTARFGAVSLDTSLQDLKPKAGWGLSAGVSNEGLVVISGGYSCTDPRGARIVLKLNDEEYETAAAYFGNAVFVFRCADKDRAAGDNWSVEFIDSEATVRKQLKGFVPR